ncbi:MAG TPA: hypothetical protein VJ253_01220, partial [Dehalococcoidia bacterium]|nr:hypothetical protein [Dehalococcoidia bacterium]
MVALRASLIILILALAIACGGGSGDTPAPGDGEEPRHARADDSSGLSEDQVLPRDFSLPIPLFAPDSAWNQTATEAEVLPESEQQML